MKNEDPETARLAQDVDVPGITLPEGDHHTGRGKYSNCGKAWGLTHLQVVAATFTSQVKRRSLQTRPRMTNYEVVALAKIEAA